MRVLFVEDPDKPFLVSDGIEASTFFGLQVCADVLRLRLTCLCAGMARLRIDQPGHVPESAATPVAHCCPRSELQRDSLIWASPSLVSRPMSNITYAPLGHKPSLGISTSGRVMCLGVKWRAILRGMAEQQTLDRAALARQKAADTKNHRTRARLFMSAVHHASAPRRTGEQITVASICKVAKVSPAAFYHHFEDGVAQLLGDVLERSMRHVNQRIAIDIAREDPSPNYQVVIAVYRVVEELFRYPNLFEVETVPRRWVKLIAQPLANAIVNDDREFEDHPGMVIAEYHANAIIGLMRRDYTPSFEFLSRLVFSQIVPVLGMADPEFGDRWQQLIHSLPPIN